MIDFRNVNANCWCCQQWNVTEVVWWISGFSSRWDGVRTYWSLNVWKLTRTRLLAVIGQFNCQSPALATPELVGGLIDRWGGIILIKTWMLKLWQSLQEKLIWYKSFCLERNVVKNLQSWLSPSYTLDINDWDNNQTTNYKSALLFIQMIWPLLSILL